MVYGPYIAFMPMSFCLPEAHIQLSAGLHGEDLGSGVDEDSTCVMSFLGCVYNLVFSSSPFFLTDLGVLATCPNWLIPVPMFCTFSASI